MQSNFLLSFISILYQTLKYPIQQEGSYMYNRPVRERNPPPESLVICPSYRTIQHLRLKPSECNILHLFTLQKHQPRIFVPCKTSSSTNKRDRSTSPRMNQEEGKCNGPDRNLNRDPPRSLNL